MFLKIKNLNYTVNYYTNCKRLTFTSDLACVKRFYERVKSRSKNLPRVRKTNPKYKVS